MTKISGKSTGIVKRQAPTQAFAAEDAGESATHHGDTIEAEDQPEIKCLPIENADARDNSAYEEDDCGGKHHDSVETGTGGDAVGPAGTEE